jgi:hypothetical protein
MSESEFEKLEHEGEGYAKEHPQQVKEGEDAIEKKVGLGQHDDGPHDDGQKNDGQDGSGDGQR